MCNSLNWLKAGISLDCDEERLLHLVVSAAEEVVPETLCDGGSDPEDLGDVLSSDQHVSVVQLHVHVRLFVQQVVGATCWS